MNNGWIKLHRKLLDNPIASKAEWAWLWVVLLLLASHDNKSFIFGRKKIDLLPGQFVTGRLSLAEKCGISPSSVERALNFMQSEQLIGQQKTTKYRLITILNWDNYQKLDSKLDSNGTATGQQRDTIKNINNTKNDKKEILPTETVGGEIPIIIDAFKDVNPVYKKWFARPPQRDACARLLALHGKEQLLKVIALLPISNRTPYFPSIMTPLQLEDKWSSLKAQYEKKKAEAAVLPNKKGFIM